MNELVEAIMKDMDKFGAEALNYKYIFEREGKKYTFTIELREDYEEKSNGEDAEQTGLYQERESNSADYYQRRCIERKKNNNKMSIH
jgi:hypothetical protein